MIEEFIRPYDLARPPLFRMKFVKLRPVNQPPSFYVLFDMHHMIGDGVSASILVQEINDLYAGKTLPELRIQYKDYAGWHAELLAGAIIENQKKYWLDQLQGEIPVLNLLSDHPRPAVFDYRGGSLKFRIGKEDLDRLNALAYEQKVTLYTVMLTAYFILLSRYTGQSDLVIGTPTAGRRHTDLQQIIGLFVNTVALRNQLEGEKSFTNFLQETGAKVLQAFDNQDYPFEWLIDDLEPQGIPVEIRSSTPCLCCKIWELGRSASRV